MIREAEGVKDELEREKELEQRRKKMMQESLEQRKKEEQANKRDFLPKIEVNGPNDETVTIEENAEEEDSVSVEEKSKGPPLTAKSSAAYTKMYSSEMVGSRGEIPISDSFLFGDDIEIDLSTIKSNLRKSMNPKTSTLESQGLSSGPKKACNLQKSLNYLSVGVHVNMSKLRGS